MDAQPCNVALLDGLKDCKRYAVSGKQAGWWGACAAAPFVNGAVIARDDCWPMVWVLRDAAAGVLGRDAAVLAPRKHDS